MALTEYPALSNLQNATGAFGRPAAIDYSTIENGHQALTNSTSNSSTASNASAYSISSHLMNENACPKLPKSFTSQETHQAGKPSSLSDHQCLKPGLLKHPLLYPHTGSPANHFHSSPHTHSPHAHSPHSPLSPLAHFSHQHLHHHLHHLQQNRGNPRATAGDQLNGNQPGAGQTATQQNLQFKPLCRTQNVNSFARLSDALHRKIEYTGSGSSLASSSTSGCVSASSSAHHFPLSPLSNSSICSPSSGPSSGPQTPQSGYVQSPLAQSFTTDSGLCLAYRGIQPANNGNAADLSSDGQSAKSEHRIDRADRRNETQAGNNSGSSASGADLKPINKTAAKRADASKKVGAKLLEQKTAAASFLNLPSQKKDTDDESLLSDYSKAELCGSGGNLGSISATSTTNLVSATTGNSANLHAAITSKPSLPGTSSSFFHYPNIYNPLKNSRNSTKHNKKLIRFFTVCAYVLCVSLVAILLSFYYLFLWNPYKSAEEPISIEQFGLSSINGRSQNGATIVNSLGNSEELDGAINGAGSIGGRPKGGWPMTALALKRSVVNDKSVSSASTSSSFRNSMMDSDQTDSGENGNNNYKPKFVNLLQQTATKGKAGV